MKPPSLLGHALELLGELDAPGPYPADARVGRFFRRRRYLGARDRRLITESAYAWLRHGLRARARWHAALAATGRAPPSEEEGTEAGRTATWPLLLDLLLLAHEGFLSWDLETTAGAAAELPFLSGAPGEWKSLVEEASSTRFLSGDPWPREPLARLAAQVSLPGWLAARLVAERGEEKARELALSLLREARLDLRVNLSRVDRETARRRLAAETGAGVEFTPFSPLGLTLNRRVNLTATTASREGWVEVQDEGSQLAAVLCAPEPGMTIIDACAGGGGKTLALADLICQEEGKLVAERRPPTRILALDVDRRRLGELARRAREAGVEDRIEIGLIAPGESLPAAVPAADLVLVDAPCSGLGTLRRNPQLKVQYGEAHLLRFAELQLSILERFAARVRPGGRLAYVTCSIVEEECDGVAARFEASHPNFEPAPSGWAALRLPWSCADPCRRHWIRLDPPRTGTDAFFIALWRRRLS